MTVPGASSSDTSIGNSSPGTQFALTHRGLICAIRNGTENQLMHCFTDAHPYYIIMFSPLFALVWACVYYVPRHDSQINMSVVFVGCLFVSNVHFIGSLDTH